MTTFRIPDTVDGVVSELNAIGQLLTAKGWQRAAIVYAWTGRQAGRPPANVQNDHSQLSGRQFADLGIYGLSSQSTVSRIVSDWEWALANGGWSDPFEHAAAKNLKPGDEVTLPKLALREHPETMGEFRAGLRWSSKDEDAIKSVRRLLEERPDVREAIVDDLVEDALLNDEILTTRIENAFVQKAGQDTDLAHRVFRAYGEHHPKPIKEKPAPSAANLGFGATLYAAVQREGEKGLQGFLDHIRIRVAADYPKTQEVLQEEIDDMEKTQGLIGQYIDESRKAGGVDVDTIFNRLVGRE